MKSRKEDTMKCTFKRFTVGLALAMGAVWGWGRQRERRCDPGR